MKSCILSEMKADIRPFLWSFLFRNVLIVIPCFHLSCWLKPVLRARKTTIHVVFFMRHYAGFLHLPPGDSARNLCTFYTLLTNTSRYDTSQQIFCSKHPNKTHSSNAYSKKVDEVLGKIGLLVHDIG